LVAAAVWGLVAVVACLFAEARFLGLQLGRPASPLFAQFDEIGIVFHRVPRPIGASAKLAIERFVLVR
jgi:hypothetical protein